MSEEAGDTNFSIGAPCLTQKPNDNELNESDLVENESNSAHNESFMDELETSLLTEEVFNVDQDGMQEPKHQLLSRRPATPAHLQEQEDEEMGDEDEDRTPSDDSDNGRGPYFERSDDEDYEEEPNSAPEEVSSDPGIAANITSDSDDMPLKPPVKANREEMDRLRREYEKKVQEETDEPPELVKIEEQKGKKKVGKAAPAALPALEDKAVSKRKLSEEAGDGPSKKEKRTPLPIAKHANVNETARLPNDDGHASKAAALALHQQQDHRQAQPGVTELLESVKALAKQPSSISTNVGSKEGVKVEEAPRTKPLPVYKKKTPVPWLPASPIKYDSQFGHLPLGDYDKDVVVTLPNIEMQSQFEHLGMALTSGMIEAQAIAAKVFSLELQLEVAHETFRDIGREFALDRIIMHDERLNFRPGAALLEKFQAVSLKPEKKSKLDAAKEGAYRLIFQSIAEGMLEAKAGDSPQQKVPTPSSYSGSHNIVLNQKKKSQQQEHVDLHPSNTLTSPDVPSLKAVKIEKPDAPTVVNKGTKQQKAVASKPVATNPKKAAAPPTLINKEKVAESPHARVEPAGAKKGIIKRGGGSKTNQGRRVSFGSGGYGSQPGPSNQEDY